MISASIVTYNTDLTELENCLNCVLACPQINRVEIVDNSRSVSIADFVKTNFPTVTYTPNDNNGYGAANNTSIKKSLNQYSKRETLYHLVLNTDIKFEPAVIELLLKKLEHDPEIGLIMPAVVYADGKPQSCCHPLPTPIDLIKHRFGKSIFPKWRQRYDILPQLVGHDINVPYMHGCFMLFRLESIKSVGMFDERFFMYPEDIDITRRLHERYKTIVTPEAFIYHLHRADSRHSIRMFMIHVTNMLKYFAKWGFFFDSQRVKFNKQLRNEL